MSSLLKFIKKSIRFIINDLKIRLYAILPGEKRLLIGSSSTSYEGWIPTDITHLNILNTTDWGKYFKHNSIDAILAEHVWEHLEHDDAIEAAKNCYKYLKAGAHLRAAVPDGHHPDINYINAVKPGGTGAGADDHKVLYTYKTFSEIFSKCGFSVNTLEWFDEDGKFQTTDWDTKDGYIIRSLKNDPRNQGGNPNYTSIIIDAIKK